MEDALYEIESMRRFTRLDLSMDALPNETTILKFRRLLETQGLAGSLLKAIKTHLGHRDLLLRQGTIVDATIIHERQIRPVEASCIVNITAYIISAITERRDGFLRHLSKCVWCRADRLKG